MYGFGIGFQMGVVIFRLLVLFCFFIVFYGFFEMVFLIFIGFYYYVFEFKICFIVSLFVFIDDLVLDDELFLILELVVRFMGFIVNEVVEGEDDVQGLYEEVFKFIFNEFERVFFRGNDVYVFVVNLEGIDVKKLEVICSYFVVRFVINRVMKFYQFVFFCVVDEDVVWIYNIFGG